jgi:hypothetical protein
MAGSSSSEQFMLHQKTKSMHMHSGLLLCVLNRTQDCRGAVKCSHCTLCFHQAIKKQVQSENNFAWLETFVC